jgi:REP element-mobilizing transposase RayT
MGAYKQILYQVVFRTKSNKPTLHANGRAQLYEYISALLKHRNCFCYQIGGVEDHLHLVFSLHPSVALSDVIKELKVASNKMIKEKRLFSNFESWADGYSAFTYAFGAKNNLVSYVASQEQHHAKVSFAEELRTLCEEHEVEIDERYFMKD